jgi:hypothetical protein
MISRAMVSSYVPILCLDLVAAHRRSKTDNRSEGRHLRGKLVFEIR